MPSRYCRHYSTTGEAFNLSFSDVATHVATALKADKILAFIEADGVQNRAGELIRQLALQECKEFLEQEGEHM